MKGKIKMKRLSAALAAFAAIAFVLPMARAADIGLPITETRVGNGPETLMVGFAGAVIGGTTDNWTITLPGITLNGLLPMAWAEPAGDAGFNDLSIVNSNTLRLVSEAPSFTPAICGVTPAPLPLGVSCIIGTDAAGNGYFANLFEVTTAAVPEPASLVLLGGALLGFGVIRRRRNRA